MLEPAALHEDALQQAFIRAAYDLHYRYFFVGGYADIPQKLSGSTWNALQVVSLTANGELLGFISANRSEPEHYVSSLAVMNFTKRINPTFSRDFYTALRCLFDEYNFRKVCWSVAVGNPAEALYDRVVKKFGGRIVGVRTNHYRLINGEWCDQKLYELVNPNG